MPQIISATLPCLKMRENPITFEMLVDQLADLKLIQAAAIPMILLVLAEWLLTYFKKKDYYDGLDTLAATVIGVVNVAQSAALKFATFGLILFFYNFSTVEHPSNLVGICSLSCINRCLSILVSPCGSYQPFLVGNTCYAS